MNSQQKYFSPNTSTLTSLALVAALVVGFLLMPAVNAAVPASCPASTDPAAQRAVDPVCAKPGRITLTPQQTKDTGLQPNKLDSAAIGKTLDGVYTIVAIIAVLMIVLAGIQIITADGDANKVATARKAIIYAAVGLVIVGSAFIITGVVQTIGS